MAGTTFALVPQLAGTRPLIRLPASGEVTVGRSAGAQIQLNAAFISRRHARLIAEAGRAYVVPLCRDDKLVTVNGVPAARGARVELRAGDAVSFVKEEADFAYRVERRAPPPANEGQTASGTKRPRAASDGDVEADYECCICSGVIAACHCLPCGHAACGECLVRWLATKRECPECRAAVPPLAVLAPVHIVDNAIEARIGAVRAAEREDWEARRSRWRRTRPDGPLRAPPSPAERGPRPRARPPREHRGAAARAAPPQRNSASRRHTRSPRGSAPRSRRDRPHRTRNHFNRRLIINVLSTPVGGTSTFRTLEPPSGLAALPESVFKFLLTSSSY